MNLRNKILLLTVGIIIVLGITLIILARTTLTNNLLSKFEEDGIFLAKHLAEMNSTNILTENHLRLQMNIDHVERENKDIAYIYISDITGKIMAHTFKQGFPSALMDIMKTHLKSEYNIEHFNTEKGDFFEVEVPMLKSQAGILHIGFTEEPLIKNIDNIVKLITGVIIIILAIGSGLAVVFASIISKPIKALTDTAKKIGSGNLDCMVRVSTKDEIGQLGTAFNKMISDMKETTVSRDYLDRMINSMIEAVVVVDSAYGIKSMNRSTLDLLEYTEEEIIGKPFAILCTDKNVCKENAAELIEHRNISNIETSYSTRTGKEIPVVLSASVISSGTVIMDTIVIVAKDNTLHKEAEKALIESQKTLKKERNSLRSALNNFSTILKKVEERKGFENLTYEPVTNLHIPVCWEIKKCKYTECPVYGMRNVRCWQIAGTHCKGEVQGQFAKKFGACEKCNIYKDSIRLPIHEIGETFNNMMHILADSQNDLIKARHTAEDSSKLKTEFLANMSHEIRTPMNAIIGMTDMVLDTELSPGQKEYLEIVKQSADSLLALLNSILDLSKIEAGKMKLKESDFNLRITLESIVRTNNVQTSRKGLNIICHINSDVPEKLRGDEIRFWQIMNNLVGNAVKFTDKGEITINVYNEVSETPHNKNNNSSIFLHFSVSDTGIGIPEDKLENIFESFTQADGSSTRKFGGTGLGLAISRNLVNMMEGRIWAERRAEGGCRFNFTARFGIAEEAVHVKQAHIMNRPETSSAKGLHILVAEDNLVNQKLTCRLLESQGFTVGIADNGKDAIEALKNNNFDLVLMDIQMPRMDGETATRIIRSSKDAGFNPDIPIIAVTAHAFEESTERFLKAGMNSCVTKPFRREELFSEIERLASVHIKPAKQEGASSPHNSKLIHFEEAMKRLGEDEDLLRELWGIFIGDAPNQMGLLEKAINENDMVLIERQAHSLKSASANIGADSLEKKAFKIEKIANSKSLNSIHVLFNDLQNEFKKVIEELKALQSNNNMIKQ